MHTAVPRWCFFLEGVALAGPCTSAPLATARDSLMLRLRLMSLVLSCAFFSFVVRLFKSFLLWSELFFAAYVCDPSHHLEGPWSAGSDTGRHYQPQSGEETGSERGRDLPVVAQPGRSESGCSSGVQPQAPISSTSTRPSTERAARPG